MVMVMRKTFGVLMILMMLLPSASGAVVLESNGYELHLNPNGNYYVGYATTFWEGIGQPYYGVFLRISDDGKLEWAYNYSTKGEVILFRALSVNEGFLLIGGTISNEDVTPLVIKVDESGKLMWARTYEVSVPDARGNLFFEALPTDSGFLVLGYSWAWSGSKRVMKLLPFNMSPSGDVSSSKLLNIEDVEGIVPVKGNGWMALGLKLVDGKLAVLRVNQSGGIEDAKLYQLPESMINHVITKVPGTFTSYVYPAEDVDVIRTMYYLNDREFKWMSSLSVRDGKVVSCLNSTTPLEGYYFYFSTLGTPMNPGIVYGTFFRNFTFVELPGSDSPFEGRFRPVMSNVSLGVLEQGEGRAYIKPLNDNVTYSFVLPGEIVEFTGDNRSVITVFDGEKVNLERFGFKKVEMKTKPCTVDLKVDSLPVNSSILSVSYRAFEVNYTPLPLKVSLIKESEEGSGIVMSPPWLSLLLVIIASLPWPLGQARVMFSIIFLTFSLSSSSVPSLTIT
jgi:hypothetical protein